jgi:hypothetical protein
VPGAAPLAPPLRRANERASEPRLPLPGPNGISPASLNRCPWSGPGSVKAGACAFCAPPAAEQGLGLDRFWDATTLRFWLAGANAYHGAERLQRGMGRLAPWPSSGWQPNMQRGQPGPLSWSFRRAALTGPLLVALTAVPLRVSAAYSVP